MKKILLLSALAVAALSAQAESFSDYFTLSYKGAALENGAVVASTDNDGSMYYCDVDVLQVSSVEGLSINVYSEYVGTPSYQQMLDDKTTWGQPSLCWYAGEYYGNCPEPPTGLVADYDLNKADNYPNWDGFQLQMHILGSYAEVDGNWVDVLPTATSTYPIKLTALVNGNPVGSFTFTVKIGPDADAAVEAVELDAEGPAQYFDLSGRPVVRPESGSILIVKEGSKVSKRVVR